MGKMEKVCGHVLKHILIHKGTAKNYLVPPLAPQPPQKQPPFRAKLFSLFLLLPLPPPPPLPLPLLQIMKTAQRDEETVQGENQR
jgi:hypothetical protein